AGTPPAARIYQSVVYDAPRKRMLMVGGYDTEHARDTNDLWSLSLGDSPKWTAITPEGTPPKQLEWGASIYDANRQRLVTFGGNGGSASEAWAVNLTGRPH